jgi:hypothetical protein
MQRIILLNLCLLMLTPWSFLTSCAQSTVLFVTNGQELGSSFSYDLASGS